MKLKIGILALQGAFIEHAKMIESLGADPCFIRNEDDFLNAFDGLILPGGESTVMGNLLQTLHLFSPIKKAIELGMPVFGTCAGLILLAKEIENDSRRYFSAMDITCRRNAYGRQLGSFCTNLSFASKDKIPAVFIRAPQIVSIGKEVKVLSEIDRQIVAAKQKNMLVTAFHPELTSHNAVHHYFIEEMIKNGKA